MGCEFIIVSSVTYALKGKSELENRGIPCKVEKLKNIASLGGCGYGIKVTKNFSSAAKRYLSLAGIRILEVIDCEAK